MALSRWGGLRNQPYDADAVDADNDGIVQEGTLFERPVGTSLVSSAGQSLRSGFNGTTLTDVDGMRIVDRRGRPVSYQPSWQGQNLPLSERLPSIGARMKPLNETLGTIDGPPQS